MALTPHMAPNSCALLLLAASALTTFARASEPDDNLTSRLDLRQPDMSAGAACSPEGQWNCMTNSFQRCASGIWSPVMSCAQGTQCSPAGLSDTMHVEFAGGGDGAARSGSARLAVGAVCSYALLTSIITAW